MIGCVLVGTTGGRILQLRRHVSDYRVLVPARAVYRQRRPVAHGGLNSLENGMVVALSQKLGKKPASVMTLRMALCVEAGSCQQIRHGLHSLGAATTFLRWASETVVSRNYSNSPSPQSSVCKANHNRNWMVRLYVANEALLI